MAFTSPVWLLALVPWTALVVWLLWGRRDQVPVPFLDLWRGPAEGPKVRSSFALPPLALIASLAAVFLAIVAAAGPVNPLVTDPRHQLRIIVDRSIAMAATGPKGSRFVELSREASEHLVRALEGNQSSRIHLTTVPDGSSRLTDLSNWAGLVAQLPPTALQTREQLQSIVHRELDEHEGPIIVVSDQPLGIVHERLVQVTSDRPPWNVGLVRIAAAEQPRAQVMVQVRNQSQAKRATITVRSGPHEVQQAVSLPPIGAERSYFFDFPAFGRSIRADLNVADELAADNVAWLVRESAWPSVEPRMPLTPELRRMLEVYRGARPVAEESGTIAITADAAELADTPGVVLAGPAAEPLPSPLVVADHPVARNVDWDRLGAVLRGGARPPPGWTPVVSAGERALLAVRDQPAKGVWVGLDPRAFSDRPEFVIFWADVLDWVGRGGAEVFASHPVRPLGSEWKPLETAPAAATPESGLWPGLYQRADGKLRAVNAPDLRADPIPQTQWQQKLASLQQAARPGLQLAPLLLLLALGCLFVAAWVWPRNRLTAFAASRTV